MNEDTATLRKRIPLSPGAELLSLVASAFVARHWVYIPKVPKGDSLFQIWAAAVACSPIAIHPLLTESSPPEIPFNPHGRVK